MAVGNSSSNLVLRSFEPHFRLTKPLSGQLHVLGIQFETCKPFPEFSGDDWRHTGTLDVTSLVINKGRSDYIFGVAPVADSVVVNDGC